MKLTLLLLGAPFKSEPERALFDLYYRRTQQLNYFKLGLLYKGTPAPRDYVVTCHESGENLSTRALAHKMQAWALNQKSVFFIVGDAYGIPPNLMAQTHERISFGAMTWPHKLARILLMEQIYRVTTLFCNKAYHHD